MVSTAGSTLSDKMGIAYRAPEQVGIHACVRVFHLRDTGVFS
jgi:hypothetical protein